jgi:hypothetical protein
MARWGGAGYPRPTITIPAGGRQRASSVVSPPPHRAIPIIPHHTPSIPCYPLGALGCTQDGSGKWTCKGVCKTGTQTCSGGTFGACVGAVTPQSESCDNKDNDCDGSADNLAPRSCTNACGSGQQTCSAGRWSDCDATGTRDCYAASTAGCTQGASGAWSCQGECKTGTQRCANGSWSSCSGQVVPQPESCDRKDENCDGTIDNLAPRACSNACGSGTQSCSAGQWSACNASASRDCYPTGTAGCTLVGGRWLCEGECKTGTQSCANGSWSACSGPVTPQTESCDNKDENCDGIIDNLPPRRCTNTCGSGTQTCKAGQWSSCSATGTRRCYPTGTAGCAQDRNGVWSCEGECQTGSQSCANGSWSACSGQTIPITESCDTLDNDCDARTDETCGQPITFAVINSNGTRAASRNISSSNLGAAAPVYTLTAASGLGCDTHTMLVTPRSSLRRPVSVTCSGTRYVVRVGGASGSTLSRAPFSAVIPPSNRGEVWGRGYIHTVNFGSGSVTYIVPDVVYGNPTLNRVDTGIYDIDSAACATADQPVFVAINSTSLQGFAVGYFLSSGKCRVRTYDLDGNLADRGFVFWIPDATKYPWALTSTTGLSAGNNFGDQYARWAAAPVTAGGDFSYFQVTYPGIDTARAAILANPRRAERMAAPVPISGGAAVYTRYISSSTLTATPIAIGFFR